MGDGELQEGQNWEAFLFGASRKIDNIIAIIDYNGKQIDGNVDDILSLSDLPQRLSSFGWKVFEMYGNDVEEVLKILSLARESLGNEQPVVIVMKTHMGFGVDFMLDNHEWHGSPPNDEQTLRALSQLQETLGDY
jgi:transketolase